LDIGFYRRYDKKMIPNILKWKPVRFAFISLIVLIFKISITGILQFFFPSKFYINYLIAHLLVLIFSYLNHSKLTFRSEYKIKSFITFTQAVILLKLIDYVIANLGVYIFNRYFVVAIVIATVVNFTLRYLILDRYVFKKYEQNDLKQN